VRLKFKRSPLDKEAISQTVRTVPVTFTAHYPPGAENLPGLLSARQLQVTEKWQPLPGKAKTGDAFTRTIRFVAPEIPAMAFPPFPAPQIDGLSIYRKDPELLDQSERSELRGERRDTITYVCQRTGHFVIPAVRLTWWDLDSKRLRAIEFPTRVLDVAPNPAIPSAKLPASQPDSTGNRSYWFAVLLLVGTVCLGLWAERNRSLLQRFFAPLRPTHLAPLNPSGEDQD
jgi:hypothetical protein